MKYGLYYFKNTHNLGDDIWAWAQSRFYPHIDYLINNTNLYGFKSKNGEMVATIMASFVEPYNYEYSFCPPNNIVPLFVGSYFRPTMLEFLNSSYMQKYMKMNEPIGCRTNELARFFNGNGIDAYFSGCITLTIPQIPVKKNDYICLVDLPEDVETYIRQKCGGQCEIKVLSHNIENVKEHAKMEITHRFSIVEKLIENYAGARCVVTTRLHAALPCLSLETPVLFLSSGTDAEGVNDLERRFVDYYPMLHHSFFSEFINGRYDYDIMNPPNNSLEYVKYRNALIDKCKQFVEACEKAHYKISSIEESDVIDALQQKIVQLKYVLDSKNDTITGLMLENRDLLNQVQKEKMSILSLQKKLRQYECFNEWENIEYFGNWGGRSKALSSFVPSDSKSLLDLGCGEMHVRKFISPDTIYYGCDYKMRDRHTIVCDLSKGEFPNIHVDVIFISGVLEYLVNWKQIIKNCSQYCSRLVMSYSTIEIAPKRDSIWVNSISHDEIIKEALLNDFRLETEDVYGTNELFCFVKK